MKTELMMFRWTIPFQSFFLFLDTQRAVASPTVSRLTDTTKFTGSHKERFDETGRGKGKAGRVEMVDTSGYVPGYKHAGSYEKKVQKPPQKPMWDSPSSSERETQLYKAQRNFPFSIESTSFSCE